MIVVFAPDLMDQSKIRAALPEAQLVRTPVELVDLVDLEGVELVIVDLDRPGVIEVLAVLAGEGRSVIGFGAHVDGERLTSANALGVNAMARSRFFGSWLR